MAENSSSSSQERFSTNDGSCSFFLPPISFDSLQETFELAYNRFADSVSRTQAVSISQQAETPDDKSRVEIQSTQASAVFRPHRSSQCSNSSSASGSSADDDEEFPMRKNGREDGIEVIEIPLKSPLRKSFGSFAIRRSLKEPGRVPTASQMGRSSDS